MNALRLALGAGVVLWLVEVLGAQVPSLVSPPASPLLPTPSPSPLLPVVLPASSPNDQARFLSGLRVSPGSPLEAAQRTPEYLEHAREYAATWRKFDGRYFGAMRAFAAGQLAPRIGPVRTLYYLFSGPDFINAYALFPDAAVYILGGLEPVGEIVPPERLDAARVRAGLENLRQSTAVTLSFSHFITKDMRVELERTDFQGVLPILLSFVALGGGEVVAVRPFSPGEGLPGVEIQFRKAAAAPLQTIYYVQADVSDSGWKVRPALGRWMAQFGPGVAYLKAASYLLHEPYFSRAREFLLMNSRAILQDDSGLPLRAFLASGPWQLTFFGRYDAPLELFAKYAQPDLRAAYAQAGATPMDFGTGYKWKSGESNLLLAIRQSAAPRALPAVVPGAAVEAGETTTPLSN